MNKRYKMTELQKALATGFQKGFAEGRLIERQIVFDELILDFSKLIEKKRCKND